MRHALTMALQLYKGALLIISHDRHLLKNTVDQFYLVAEKTIRLFDGDLADYQQWLRESLQQQSKDSDNGSESHNEAKTESKVDKKLQRQQDAAKREQLKPLTNAIKKIEKTMAKTEKELADIESQLSDESIYSDDNKGQLQALLKQQGEHRSALETLEEDWLTTHEEIESYQ